jgi:hydrogenase maturation protease
MSASSETRVTRGVSLDAPVTLPRREVLVLALGNPIRGDDGVGAAILSTLEGDPQVGAAALVDGGTPGLETLLMLQGYRRAIILDAAEMGQAPGTWRRFTPDEADWQPRMVGGSLHDAGLAEALSLGAALGTLPPSIVIYGIQPAAIGWEPGLTRPVQDAVPAVVDAVLDDLRGALRPNDEDM